MYLKLLTLLIFLSFRNFCFSQELGIGYSKHKLDKGRIYISFSRSRSFGNDTFSLDFDLLNILEKKDKLDSYHISHNYLFFLPALIGKLVLDSSYVSGSGGYLYAPIYIFAFSGFKFHPKLNKTLKPYFGIRFNNEILFRVRKVLYEYLLGIKLKYQKLNFMVEYSFPSNDNDLYDRQKFLNFSLRFDFYDDKY